MPLANSYNVTGTANEEPKYQILWEPIAVNTASTVTATTYPTAIGPGAWVPGAALQWGPTGTTMTAAGTNWPAGATTVPPAINTNVTAGDDYGGLSTPYTLQTVDLAAVSTVQLLAGVLLGVGSLGGFPPSPASGATTLYPNAGRLSPLVAMVGKRGLVQVLMDPTTTAVVTGHTIKPSGTATVTGQFIDTGATTPTYGTTCGLAFQTVTIGTAPKLIWCYVNVAF
jgi:hypothetical protein